MLRSKTPELVRQEFYGFLLAHFAVRQLMHEAALSVAEDPDQLSFSPRVRVVRRKLSVCDAIPPQAIKTSITRFLTKFSKNVCCPVANDGIHAA